ncbi:hypothetical protein H0H81_002819 [Sphagnurus paluster]|uniref:Uncharacterized protein n=1 Tax=Sphagnurus paluster TaxID=117069 RepID=A0A9P7KKC6_9AGAR|nr:hypothetical protein H0H81_002819 [Sphagnurus paluster]
MPETTSKDLSQVSALFKDCLTIVRNQPAANLDATAEQWLTTARCDLMKQLEQNTYHEVARNIASPHIRHWSDPNSSNCLRMWERI